MSLPLERLLEILQAIAPLEFAEDWDNVGLLVEPRARAQANVERVLLTIDLTPRVLEEAITWGAELVVAYHPPLFQGLKRLRSAVLSERVLVSAIQHDIFIYSPHTALDAAPNGMTDWLLNALGPGQARAIIERPVHLAASQKGAGVGRIVELAESISLDTLVRRVKEHLGLSQVRLAAAEHHLSGKPISCGAVCPGAGGSVFEKVSGVDVFLTGEMRHHDVFAKCLAGASVILCDHTNTERGFLPELAKRVRELARAAAPELAQSPVDVKISECDRDPLQIT